MAYFGKVLRNYSDVAFGTSAQYGSFLNEVPRQKFEFAVEFIPSSVNTSNRKAWFELFKDLSLVVQSVDLPSFQFDVQTLNQYNRKRVIQTKVNWNPITMTFFDTRDNKFQNVLNEYFKWSYREGRENYFNFGPGSLVPDVVTANPRIHDFGYQTPHSFSVREKSTTAVQPNVADAAAYSSDPPTDQDDYLSYEYDKYFFSRIVIHRYVGGHYGAQTDPVEIFNPTIMAVNHDTLNYSDSSPIQWTVTFAYEGVNYPETKGDNDSRMNSMWDRAKKTAGDVFGSDGSASNTTKTEGTSDEINNYTSDVGP